MLHANILSKTLESSFIPSSPSLFFTLFKSFRCLCACVLTCVHACMCAYMCVHICVCAYMCAYECVSAYVCVCYSVCILQPMGTFLRLKKTASQK